jgi:predicted dehydrogenase
MLRIGNSDAAALVDDKRAACLYGSNTSQPSRKERPMLRFGILSTAKIAREHVIPALLDAGNCVVTAIGSRDLERGRETAQRFGISEVHGSYDALLASPNVDAVYIPLPTSQHVEWAVRAAEAGKHVLVEKPLALKAEQIDAVIAARDKAGVVVSEAFMVFYHPQWRKVRELIAGGAIGKLRRIDGAFTYANRDPGNMRNQLALGGGALADIGVYPVITARFATGMEPQRVRATVERDPDFGTDRYASAVVDFGDFEMGFYCSTQMALRQAMVFHGDQGTIEVAAPFNAGEYDLASVTLHTVKRDRSEVFRFSGVRQYRLQAEAFAEKIAGGNVDLFELEASRANQKVIDAIFRAGEHEGWEAI